MSLSPEKIADLKLKHLEMIQGVVNRMAAQCATLKNYCVTISVAVAGFAITLQRPIVVLLTLIPIMSFAILDAKYLKIERRFRARFDAVSAEGWEAAPTFNMGKMTDPVLPYWPVFFSWSVAGFYVPLAVVAIAAVATARQAYDKLL